MNKTTCVIYAPVETYSGYGARSRDIAKAIIELKQNKWDIKIISCRWGATPNGFLENNPEWGFLKQYIIPTQLTFQPDVMIWVTIPSEFHPIGKYNIGITAGIESTIAPAEWVEGCQRMDLILGSSKHTIDVLRSSKFEKKDQHTHQSHGIIEWTKPGEVLFEGVKTETYKQDNSPCLIDFNIKEDFAYLFLGHWLPGQIGEDRKNTGLLVKAFLEVFKNKKKTPALILKTSTVSSSYMDRQSIVDKIKSIISTVKARTLPNIYLLHGDFIDEEINSLYNHSKVKAMVNLTKGEGFGRPLLEFSCVNKPIITTNWSGHIDYLDSEFTTLLPGQLTNIHPTAANNMLLKEAQWFSVDMGQVGHYLKDVFENYKNYQEKAKRQGYKSRNEFSYEKMKETLEKYLDKHVPEFPKQVQLNLPKLQLPKLSKITS